MTEFKSLFGIKPVLLAPMFEVTNMPFRLFCKEQGANGSFTEFVSINQLIFAFTNKLQNSNKVKYLLMTEEKEKPVGLQVFGYDQNHFEQLSKVFNVQKAGFDFLDLNIGCPVPKICNIGAGSKLLDDLPKLEKILISIKKNFPDIPFSIKIRAGYKKLLNFKALSEILNSLELLHVTIHPKLAINPNKDSLNNADHSISKTLVELVNHPIIINGGINSLEMANILLKETNAAGTMIGRQAQRFPWVFNSKYQKSVPNSEYITGINHFLDLSEYFGVKNFNMVKDQIFSMVRGFNGSKQQRINFPNKIQSIETIRKFVTNIEEYLINSDIDQVFRVMQASKTKELRLEGTFGN